MLAVAVYAAPGDTLLVEDFDTVDVSGWWTSTTDVTLSTTDADPVDGTNYWSLKWSENLTDSTWFTDAKIFNFGGSEDWDEYKDDPYIVMDVNNNGASDLYIRYEYVIASGSWGSDFIEIPASDGWTTYSQSIDAIDSWGDWGIGLEDFVIDTVPTIIKLGINTKEPSTDPSYEVDYSIDNIRVVNYVESPDAISNLTVNAVSVYPNPALDVIYVGVETAANVEIINLMGATVKSFADVTASTELDISDLTQGVYFIKTQDSIQKFIKK
jgi:hypothetical protein